ncbi:hypothetical protein [Vibrio sp. WXL210]
MAKLRVFLWVMAVCCALGSYLYFENFESRHTIPEIEQLSAHASHHQH